MVKRALGKLVVLFLACLIVAGVRAADKPLDPDDITLLLLGGATTDRMMTLIQHRGVSFRMTPDLAKKFHDAGADDIVIEALQKAGANVQSASPVPSAPAPAATPQASAPTEAEMQHKIAATYTRDVEAHPLAPAFLLTGFSGEQIGLRDYQGKVVMVNFWATWCPPCRSEIPKLIELQDKYGKKGFQIIGILTDDTKKAALQFFQMYHVNYPVALIDFETRRKYEGIASLPSSWLIGRDGRVYAKVNGAPADLNYFDGIIKRLLDSSAGDQEIAANKPGDGSATGASATGVPTGAAPASAAKGSKGLSDPSSLEIQHVIQEFAAKEKLFREARNNYTYHQINKVQQLDPDGNTVGTFEQEWDILYDDNGKRIERVTYAPPDTLKNLLVTKEDLDAMRSIQPFVLSTEELPEYEVKYLGHVKLDEITAYVFSIRPKEIKKDRLYFQGTAWVDDRDLQIVKTEGRIVPELKTKKGENLFPRFTTYREQIDGKFWFPTYTMAKDTLYFSTGAVDIKQTIRYTEYKQFKSKVRILSTETTDVPAPPKGNSPAKPNK